MDREVEKRLADRVVRYTRGRRLVVAALEAADGPKSAAELHGSIGPVLPLSSLYRSLSVLEEAGVVSPHLGAKGLVRYELAEWLTGHHHHLVCLDCGIVEDIAIPHPYEEQVLALVADIGSVGSFTPTSHTLDIEGRCARCA
ncbi:MAG: Fur family transcriptional regulator [Acidimicrobiia bacterium]